MRGNGTKTHYQCSFVNYFHNLLIYLKATEQYSRDKLRIHKLGSGDLV